LGLSLYRVDYRIDLLAGVVAADAVHRTRPFSEREALVVDE
jgi:hypothetical protein